MGSGEEGLSRPEGISVNPRKAESGDGVLGRGSQLGVWGSAVSSSAPDEIEFGAF